MEKQQTRYSRLANITKIINTKLELRDVLRHVTTAISEEIVQCDAVGFYLPQEDGTYRGFVGKPEDISGQTLDMQVIDPATDMLAKEVIETRKTIYIHDTSQDDRPDERPVEDFKMKSILALPISFEQELFGLVFLFNHGTPMNLTELEIQSVESYVNMAAVAIRNANILKQQEHLIAEKQLLLHTTRDLSMCSSMEESFDKCFFYLGKLLDNHNLIGYLLDPIDKRIMRSGTLNNENDRVEVDWSQQNRDIDQTFRPFMQKVIETKTGMLIPDVYADERLDSSVCESLHINSLLIMPLVSLGEALGIIVVANIEISDKNLESQLKLAQSLVDTTASSISNLLYMSELENIVNERTRELASANEKLTSVIESITDGFISLDKEWRYTYINKYHHLPRHKTIEEVLGKNVWEIYPDSVNTTIYQKLHQAMVERVPVNFEFQSIYEDLCYEVAAYPFEDGICCLFKNITEKKKYEWELKRLSGLELIAQMAAGISHEIRNPMTTVRGFLQLLQDKVEFIQYANYFHLMIEELDRANSIITEFLSMGKTRTSDLNMMDLNTIIQDIAPLILIDAFNQEKNVQVDTQETPFLLLNSSEMRQLVINLSRNGLEAMNKGQMLSIKTYMEGEDCVVLAIHNQGKGISPEVLEKMGTPFFTTKDSGTGLGLGVCYAIAARHNAKIEVTTGESGTTFLVKFSL
jgi:nitrogen-specific signal transduction histidine kinase/GAF domain-containing protein